MSIGKRNESAFSMMLNWESILTDLVKRKIELNEPVLSLKNNYLSFYANEHNAVVQKNLEKIKLWALGRLN